MKNVLVIFRICYKYQSDCKNDNTKNLSVQKIEPVDSKAQEKINKITKF